MDLDDPVVSWVSIGVIRLGDLWVRESPVRSILLSDLSLFSACQMPDLACYIAEK